MWHPVGALCSARPGVCSGRRCSQVHVECQRRGRTRGRQVQRKAAPLGRELGSGFLDRCRLPSSRASDVAPRGKKHCGTGALLQDSPCTWSLGSGESSGGRAGGVTLRPVCAQTLQYLQQNAKERAELAAAGSSGSFSAPAAASKMSMQELEELRKQLGSVATGATVQQVPSLCGAGLSSGCWPGDPGLGRAHPAGPRGGPPLQTAVPRFPLWFWAAQLLRTVLCDFSRPFSLLRLLLSLAFDSPFCPALSMQVCLLVALPRGLSPHSCVPERPTR